MSYVAGNADKEFFSSHENERALCEWKCKGKMSSALSQFSNQQELGIPGFSSLFPAAVYSQLYGKRREL